MSRVGYGMVASLSFRNREQRVGQKNGQKATDVREEGHQRRSGGRR